MRRKGRERKDLYSLLMRAGVVLEVLALICLAGTGLVSGNKKEIKTAKQANAGGIWEILEKHQRGEMVEAASGDYIKWVDFTVPAEAMNKAYQYDIDSYGQEVHMNWIELLAYAAARQGGEFGKEALKNIDDCAAELQKGKSMEKLTEKLKYYPYYLEAYTAVLGGFVGEYEAEGETRYGLKAFSPIAKDFPYTDYDDLTAKIGLIRKALTASLGWQHPDRMETTLATILGMMINEKPVLPDAGNLFCELLKKWSYENNVE